MKSIRALLKILLVILLVAGFVIGGVAFVVKSKVQKGVQDMAMLAELEKSLSDLMVPYGNYLITSDKSEKDVFEKQRAKVQEILGFFKNRGYDVSEVERAVEKINKVAMEIFAVDNPIGKKECIEKKKVLDAFIENELKNALELLEADIQSSIEEIDRVLNIFVALTVVFIIVLGIYVFVLIGWIGSDVDNLSKYVSSMARGRFDVTMPRFRMREVVSISKCVNKLKHNIAVVFGHLTSMYAITGIALTKIGDKVEMFIKLISEWMSEIKGVAEDAFRISRDVSSMADQLNEYVDRLREMSNSLLAGVDESVASMEKLRKVGISMEQMVEDIKAISRKMDESKGTVEKMVELSKGINEFVGRVSEIAGKTNLLALNASIEAARAGEAGRSFAVVADEIRKLAAGAKQTAEEIGEAAAGIISEVKVTNEVVDMVTEEFNALAEEFMTFAKVLREGVISSEQVVETSKTLSSSILEMVKVVEDIAARMNALAQTAEDIGQSSEQLLSRLQRISGIMQGIRRVSVLADVINESAESVNNYKFCYEDADMETILELMESGEMKEILLILGGVLNANYFWMDKEGKPIDGKLVVPNPVCKLCRQNNLDICMDSHKRMIKLIKEKKGIVVDICDGGFIKSAAPVFDKNGEFVGGISVCGIIPPDWRSRIDLYHKISGMPKDKIEEKLEVKFTFSKEEVEEILRRLNNILLSKVSEKKNTEQ